MTRRNRNVIEIGKPDNRPLISIAVRDRWWSKIRRRPTYNGVWCRLHPSAQVFQYLDGTVDVKNPNNGMVIHSGLNGCLLSSDNVVIVETSPLYLAAASAQNIAVTTLATNSEETKNGA